MKNFAFVRIVLSPSRFVAATLRSLKQTGKSPSAGQQQRNRADFRWRNFAMVFHLFIQLGLKL
jgi:hypothetical protein